MPVGTIIPAVADVLHSTLTKSRRKLVMASIKSNALMAWVFANNRVEYEDGGYNITNPLTVGRNPNITSPTTTTLLCLSTRQMSLTLWSMDIACCWHCDHLRSGRG